MNTNNYFYQSLNDAATAHPEFPELTKGETKIFYMKPEHFRSLCFGYSWAKKEGTEVTKKSIVEETHVLLGEVIATDLEMIFVMMQGENWPPRGEARHLLTSLGIGHTTMSVGDVVQIGEQFFMVGRGCAWEEIKD